MRKLRGNAETLRLRTAVRELAESGLGRGAQDSFSQNAHVQSVQCIGEQKPVVSVRDSCAEQIGRFVLAVLVPETSAHL